MPFSKEVAIHEYEYRGPREQMTLSKQSNGKDARRNHGSTAVRPLELALDDFMRPPLWSIK